MQMHRRCPRPPALSLSSQRLRSTTQRQEVRGCRRGARHRGDTRPLRSGPRRRAVRAPTCGDESHAPARRASPCTRRKQPPRSLRRRSSISSRRRRRRCRPRRGCLGPSRSGCRQIAAEQPELVGPPRRSTFAPDPVRQRTYVDLRNPAPVPEKAASDDPPWRKYLAEPRRQGSRHAVSIHTEARRAEVRHHPALVAASYDTADDARERARGIRAMSAGALLGLGIGLGLLVLIRPSAEPVVSSMTAPQPASAPRVIAAADVATQTAHSAADWGQG